MCHTHPVCEKRAPFFHTVVLYCVFVCLVLNDALCCGCFLLCLLSVAFGLWILCLIGVWVCVCVVCVCVCGALFERRVNPSPHSHVVNFKRAAWRESIAGERLCEGP